MTLLRLYKEEITGFNVIIQKLSDRGEYSISAMILHHYMLWMKPRLEPAHRKFQITNDEVEEIKRFFEEYYLPSLEQLQLAIEYFNKSYIEPYTPRDAFLDLMIAMENLYLKGITDELGFRLRMRMARVLGSDYQTRKDIYDFVKKAYVLRGKIVHGEKHDPLSQKYLFKIRQLVRDSIKLFLKNPQMRDDLDDLLLKSELNLRISK